MSSPPAGYERVREVSVLTEARAWLETLGLTSVESAFAHAGEARLNADKSLVRLAAPDGSVVFVKRWDFNRPGLWLRAAVKLNFPVYSGPSELTNLLELRAAGLRVPTPLAAGERDQGARRQSFVALGQLRGQPLDSLPPPTAPIGRRERLSAVAALVRSLHGAGFCHKDLYACNVFWDEGEGAGLLDCERVERKGEEAPLRWRVKDLAALDYSAAWPTRTERLRFLLAVLGRERLDADAKRLVRAVQRKSRGMAKRGAKD